MSRMSYTLLHSSQGKLDMVGEPLRLTGYNEGMHTVALYVANFKGRIWIEASLANNPTDHDWFPIYLNGDIPYVEYPLNRARPTGNRGGDTGIDAYNFQANVLWIRARVDRSYIKPQPTNQEQIAQLGIVRKIMLNN